MQTTVTVGRQVKPFGAELFLVRPFGRKGGQAAAEDRFRRVLRGQSTGGGGTGTGGATGNSVKLVMK